MAAPTFGQESGDPVLRTAPLEPDRVMPANPAKNLPLQTEPGKTDYLLYNDIPSERNNPILYLKIPYEYTGGESLPVHNWSVNLVVWYPEMTGPFNPANRGRKDCAGWCKGEIMLSIENWKDRGYTVIERRLKVLQEDMAFEQASKPEERLTIHTKLQVDGFDEVYEINEINFPKGNIHRVYIKRSVNGDVEFYANCVPYAISPACEVELNMIELHNIYVSYAYSMSAFNDWKALDNKVRDLVKSFVVAIFDKY